MWSIIQAQIPDPFLNRDDNIEMVRRIKWKVIGIACKVFERVCKISDNLYPSNVFSTEANETRTRAMLTLELSKRF